MKLSNKGSACYLPWISIRFEFLFVYVQYDFGVDLATMLLHSLVIQMVFLFNCQA